ncbi:MAG TPA: AAA family ATPase [Acidimicrobiales bacterium]|nr:AAA family ATPase [Acidimicrobiales bacterium]
MEALAYEVDCWQDFADVIAAGIGRVLLYGPPGTGKTYAALHAGTSTALAERLICTEDLTAGEITGTWMPGREGVFSWREGPAIRAWRGADGSGARLVLDEVDRASGDALATLLAVTDSRESARWRHPETLEWVRPGPNFSVVMTSNIEELDDLPSSLLDRFAVRIRVDRPHSGALSQLSVDLREAARRGSVGPSDRRVSLRSFYAYDELRTLYGANRAARLVFGDNADAVLDALRVGALA